MKGVILAGGTGSRLRPITHTGPKQLVPVANKPVIDYAVEDLVEAGITEVAVVLGTDGREAIQSHLGDGSELGVEITYVVQGEPLGLAHAVGCCRAFVGDDPFVVYLGDDLMREGIVEFVEDFDPDRYAAGIGLQRVDDPSRYGVVEVDGGVGVDAERPAAVDAERPAAVDAERPAAVDADGTAAVDGDGQSSAGGEDAVGDVIGLVEKPEDPPSDLALIGVYVFTPDVFEQIADLEPSWRGELEVTEAIQGLIDDGHRVQSHVVHGWWKDAGKPEDVVHANRLVLDDLEASIEGEVADGASVTGRVELGADSTIEAGATVRGPVSIGERTTIESGTYVGPYTSVGDDCEIAGAHLESSVLIGGATVRCDRRIVDSVIGRNASIRTNEDRQPAGDRLVVGRNSELEL